MEVFGTSYSLTLIWTRIQPKFKMQLRKMLVFLLCIAAENVIGMVFGKVIKDTSFLSAAPNGQMSTSSCHHCWFTLLNYNMDHYQSNFKASSTENELHSQNDKCLNTPYHQHTKEKNITIWGNMLFLLSIWMPRSPFPSMKETENATKSSKPSRNWTHVLVYQHPHSTNRAKG